MHNVEPVCIVLIMGNKIKPYKQKKGGFQIEKKKLLMDDYFFTDSFIVFSSLWQQK
jgi:hypothetical protein